MKILTVDADSTTGGTMHHVLAYDKDTFNISAADCGADCQCGRHTAHAKRDQEQRQVSDSELRALPLKDVIKLAGPKVSATSDEASLGRRATTELHRRFLLTGDTADPDPVNMQALSVTELIRCTAPRQERLTERQSVLAKRALTELFRRQHGG